jgi:hypothetical protein
MGDDLDVDFCGSVALPEVGGGIRHIAAERFERVPFDMQPFDVGALHVPDVGVFIEGGFQHCNAHWRKPLAGAYITFGDL